MWHFAQLNDNEKRRLENIIDMGLAWSAMMRVFEKGSKKKKGSKAKLQSQIVYHIAEKVFNASSKDEFVKIHSEFCDWGTRNITQRDGSRARYGQIAKTLDIVLKVAIYYCHLPDQKKSEKICQWLYAAVDTAMMRELKKSMRADFPDVVKPWPTSLKQVDESTYHRIQRLVRESINRDHRGITGPQWDDKHWEEANR
jgi:hypothetical protein